MYSWNLEKERLDAEAYLTGPRNDFVTTYMNVANLQFIIKEHPDIISGNTATALLAVLSGTEHASQKQNACVFDDCLSVFHCGVFLRNKERIFWKALPGCQNSFLTGFAKRNPLVALRRR